MKRFCAFCSFFTFILLQTNFQYIKAQQVIDMMNNSTCAIQFQDMNFKLVNQWDTNEEYDWVAGSPLDPSPRYYRHSAADAGKTDIHCSDITYLPPDGTSSIRMGSDRYRYGDYPKGGVVSFAYTVTQANAIALFKYAGLIDKSAHTNMFNYNFASLFQQIYNYNQTQANEAEMEMRLLAQPWINIYLKVGNSIIDCTKLQHAVYHLDKTEGWLDGTGDVKEIVNGQSQTKRKTYYRYKPWTTVAIDLSKYINQRVTIVAEYRDCAIEDYTVQYQYLWGELVGVKTDHVYCSDHHFARFYCNLTCTSNQLTLVEEKCSPQPQVTYKAPDGFVSYSWYSSKNTSKILSTGQTCTYVYNGSEALDLCCSVKSSTDCAATVLKQHIVYCPANCITPEMTFVGDQPNGVTYKVTDGFSYQWYTSKDPSQIISTQQTCTYNYDGDEELYLCCRLTANSECTPVILKQYLISETACDSYTACNGTVYSSTGNYDFTCASIGAATPVHLHLVVNHSSSATDEATVCESELPYTWESETFTAAGTKTLTLKTINGCDSVVTFTLNVNKTYNITDEATVCDSELPYTWEGETFTAAGSRTKTLKTIAGCDSIVTFTLNVNKTYNITDGAIICDSELPYTWEGEKFTGAGSQTKTLKTIAGCDSVVTFTLTVNKTYNLTDGVTICESELPYTWEGEKFTAAGTKTKKLTSKVTGCDSTVTFTLTVNKTIHKSVSRTVCEKALPYKWDGLTFGGEGMQTRKLKSLVTGCDSVVDYHLSVSTGYMLIDGATVCSGDLPYTWEGETFTASGTKTKFLQSKATGCDSIVTFTLTVLTAPTTTVTDIFCEGDTYAFGDTLITEAGTYIKRFAREGKCDSVVTLALVRHPKPVVVVQEETVTDGDTYTWVGHGSQFASLTIDSTYRDTLRYTTGGCDSVYYTLHLRHSSPDLRAVVSADTVCADDPAFTLRLQVSEGKPQNIDVIFGEKARKQNFSDIKAVSLTTDGTEILAAVDMPFDASDSARFVRPDTYDLTVRVTAVGGKVFDFPSSLTVLYPSWILFQRWNDILAISNADHNGGYTFSAIRWFHAGKPVEARGEHDAYIYQSPSLSMGEPYWAELTRTDDSKTIRTCVFYPEVQTEDIVHQDLHVRLLPRRNADSRQAQIEADAEGTYIVYDFAGRSVLSGVFSGSDSDLVFPSSAAEGTYLVFFRADDGRTASRKWIVQ